MNAVETMKDLLWVTMNLDDNNRTVYAGPSLAEARRVASALVGNSSFARTDDIHLYGPGDGSTSVMVRQIPRVAMNEEARFGRDGRKCYDACKAVLDDLHSGDDGFWRAGPWADPSTEDGKGGKVQMLREAVANLD